MGDDRFVDVHGPLGRASGAAGEVQQRRILGIGGSDRVLVAGGVHQPLERQGARGLAIGDHHVPERGKRRDQVGDPASEQCLRGDENPGGSLFQPDPDRFGPERGEQGTEHGAGLQGAQGRDVQFRYAAGQRAYRVAPADAQALEDVGEAVAQEGHFGIADLARAALAIEKTERDTIAVTAGHMPVQGLVRDIEAASAGKAIQFPPRRPPNIHTLPLAIVFR